jgi:hypothetical protein
MNESSAGVLRQPRLESRRNDGPNPGVLALVSFLLLLAGLIVGGILSQGATLSSPFASSAEVAQRLHDHWLGYRLAALFQFGSAIPLGIYAATIYALQLRLGIRVPGPNIGFYGGIAASIFVGLSALLFWVLSHPEITADATLTHALSYLAFITGGMGFVVSLGLLIAGIAVPGLILGLVPAWFAWAGLVIAALSELSFLSMVIEPLQFLLPIGRFLGMIWLITAGFMLPQELSTANRDAS